MRPRAPLGYPGGLPVGLAQDVRGPSRHVGRRLPGDHGRGRPRHDSREEAPGGLGCGRADLPSGLHPEAAGAVPPGQAQLHGGT
eukprot:1106484-Alexandrium_andersonii.AAC.1